MTTSAQFNWFVAQTQPHAEVKAADHLGRQGFETYLPRYIKTVRHARRVSAVKAALFPNYLFVRFDVNTARWRAINSTVGVMRLVGHDTSPTPLAESVVEGLKKHEGTDGFFEIMQPAARFKVGDAIRVCEGAFNSFYGIFEARTDKERVTVLLDLLGRKSRVMLNLRSIEAA